MKTRRIVGVLCVLAVMGLTIGAGSASADTTLLSYNFNSLSAGPLAGQDGFSKTLAWGADLAVAAGPAGSLNTSNCVYLTNEGGIGDNESRSLASPLVFNAASPTTNQTLQVYSGDTGGGYTSLTFNGGPSYFPLFGVEASRRPYIRDTAGNETQGTGDAILVNKWYEFKMAMDFSVEGGQGTLYYRNMTDGETAFTAAAGLSNIALAIAQNGSGEYIANAFGFRIDGSSATMCMDNFAVSQVPEPSAVILAATGLVGLLACAWRKRR
jgi:hypothetical protein